MDAGSINVKITGDITDLQTAFDQMQGQINKATQANANLGKSFFTAQLAIEGLKKGFQIAVQTVTELINAFKETEITERRLQTVIGGNIDSYKKFASEIQRTTTIEDESVLQTITLAKTMGIADEALNNTSLQAIGLSKAFNLDLNTATKLTVLATQNNYDMLQRYIPALRTTKDETQKQAIVQQAMAKGLQIAKDEAQTFTGQLIQLQNAQGDLKEEAGRIIAVFGIDIVTAMKDATNSITDFITSAKGIESIANVGGVLSAIFQTAANVGNDLKKSFEEGFGKVIETITTKVGKLTSGINVLTPVMFALSTISKYLGLVFSFWGNIINGVVTGILNIALAIKNGIGILATFGKALITGDWTAANKKISEIGDSFTKFADNIKKKISDTSFDSLKDGAIKTFQDIGNAVIGSGKDILDDTKRWTKDYEQTIVDSTNSIKDKLSGKTSITAGGENDKKTITPDNNKLKSELSISVQLYSDSSNEIANIISNTAETVGSGFSNITNSVGNLSEVFSKSKSDFKSWEDEFTQKASAVGGVMSSIAQAVGSAFQSMMDIIKASTDKFYQDQLDSLTAHHDSQIEKINERLEREIELIENDGMTKAEAREAEIADLETQLASETDIQKKADIEKSLSELKKEKAIEKAKLDADKQKAMSDYKMAKAKYNLDKQQFEINKTMQIVSATMSYLLGLVMLWANVWSLGPIAGAIMGGVMTGVLTGIFVASVATLASQTFTAKPPEAPAFATGGIIGGTAAGTMILAGENSNPEAILNQDQMLRFMELADGRGGGGGQTINLIVDGDILKTWLLGNQNKENLLAY